MNIKQFTSLIKSKEIEIKNLMRNQMPVIAGRIAKNHFQDNFHRSGFVNNGITPWKESKRLSSGAKGANANYKTLLSSRNNLYSSIKYVPGDGKVKISTTVSYASAHNFGETVKPKVTQKMKAWAWAKYFEETGIKKGMDPAAKKELNKSASETAKMYKGLALTKKQSLSIKMPKRKFIGESAELNKAIADEIDSQILNILNK